MDGFASAYLEALAFGLLLLGATRLMLGLASSLRRVLRRDLPLRQVLRPDLPRHRLRHWCPNASQPP
jgi:hypothetical protein